MLRIAIQVYIYIYIFKSLKYFFKNAFIIMSLHNIQLERLK